MIQFGGFFLEWSSVRVEGLSFSVEALQLGPPQNFPPKTLGAAAPGGSTLGSRWAQMFSATLWSCRLFWTKICQTILPKSDTFGYFQPNWLSFAGLTGHSIWECLGFQKKRALIRSLTVLIVLIVCSIPKFTDKETPSQSEHDAGGISWNRQNQIATNGFCVLICALQFQPCLCLLMAHVAHASFMKPVSWSRCFWQAQSVLTNLSAEVGNDWFSVFLCLKSSL